MQRRISSGSILAVAIVFAAVIRDGDRRRIVQEWLHDAPGFLHAVLTGEEAGVAFQGVAEKPFIRLGGFAELLGEDQGEIHRSGRPSSGFLGLQHQVRSRIGIDPQHELVGVGANCGAKVSRGGGLKMIRNFRDALSSDLPARMKNGTPDQRQLSISRRRAAKVSVCEAGLTPGTDRYPSY